MTRTALIGAVAALGLSSVAFGQTTTECDPLLRDDCPHDPAFGGDASFDFTTASSLTDLDSFWKVDDGVKYKNGMVTFDNGAHFTMNADSDAPTLISKNYLFFGKVEVTLQAAPGAGIVTSIVLQSDDRDEIDWEFIGSHQSVAETNFYSKGVNDYTHSDKINVAFNPMTDIHTYTLDWTPDYIKFLIDGQVVRTATPKDADNGAKWPQTPAQVRLGTWVGGAANQQPGTVDWAGGHVDWSKGPFAAVYKTVKITDYGNGVQGATEYSYGDRSGTFQSIKIEGGKAGSLPDGPSSSDTHTAPTTTSTTSTASSTPISSSASSSAPATTSSSSVVTTATTVGLAQSSGSGAATTISTSVTKSPSGTGNALSSEATGKPADTVKPNGAGPAVALPAGLLVLLLAPLLL